MALNSADHRRAMRRSITMGELDSPPKMTSPANKPGLPPISRQQSLMGNQIDRESFFLDDFPAPESVIRQKRQVWARDVRKWRGQEPFEQFCDMVFAVGLQFAKGWIISWNEASFQTSGMFFLLNFFLFYGLWFSFVSFANRFFASSGITKTVHRTMLFSLMLLLLRVQDCLNFMSQLLPALHKCDEDPSASGCFIGKNGETEVDIGANQYSWQTYRSLLDSISCYVILMLALYALMYGYAWWDHDPLRSEGHLITHGQVRSHCIAHLLLYGLAVVPVLVTFWLPEDTDHDDHPRLMLILLPFALVYTAEIYINLPSKLFQNFPGLYRLQKVIYIPMDIKHLIQRFHRFTTIMSGLCFVSISTSFNHASNQFSLSEGENWEALKLSASVLLFAVFNYLLYVECAPRKEDHACNRRSSGVWWQLYHFIIYFMMLWVGGVVAYVSRGGNYLSTGVEQSRFSCALACAVLLFSQVSAHLRHTEQEKRKLSVRVRKGLTLFASALIVVVGFQYQSIEKAMLVNCMIYGAVYGFVLRYGFQVKESEKKSKSDQTKDSPGGRQRSRSTAEPSSPLLKSVNEGSKLNMTNEFKSPRGYGSLEETALDVLLQSTPNRGRSSLQDLEGIELDDMKFELKPSFVHSSGIQTPRH